MSKKSVMPWRRAQSRRILPWIGGFGILGRGDVVDDGLDAVGVEHPVLAPGHQIHDGDGVVISWQKTASSRMT
jgi:hypothetical protein